MFIAVSGNIGSGKTTLARYLSCNYDLCYVPRDRLEFNFLDVFFKDVEGKFLLTQLSFLISKSIELQKLLQNKENIVLDRSLKEDIEVFARLWIENCNIEKKIADLYNRTADFIRQTLPEPDLYIFCSCSANISRQRIANRPVRNFEKQYPPDHIELLEKYYKQLITNLKAPCVEINTEQYDFTEDETLPYLCTEIFKQFAHSPYFCQLSLFDEPIKQNVQGLIFHNFDQIHGQHLPAKNVQYIYLAAPFTQMAPPKQIIEADDISLFSTMDENTVYGMLNVSYQTNLKKIAQAIAKHCQIPVYLPHRDINKWGKINYPTEYLTPRLIETVEKATAIVAIPGNSIGVHLELGIAIARHIPIVIFDTNDFSNSFFVRGFMELPYVKYIQVPSLSKIPSNVVMENISAFISEKI